MKRIIVFITLILSSLVILPSNVCVHAADDEFSIIKKAKVVTTSYIKEIWSEWWKVMDKYREKAEELDEDAGEQLAIWIMSWNTILNYLVFVVQFLSQLWLLVWVMFIMYAWYKYMVSVFVGWKTNNAPEMLKNAIIWVIIVIFSYAIMKTLTSFIWIS